MSIGETLAQARHEAGLSVTQVSEKTRIREGIIRDIERDDYSACGGDFYARGHIRAIARAYGTDSEPLIREYDEARRPPDEYPATEDEFGHPGPPGAHQHPAGYEAAVDDTTFGGYSGAGEYTPPLRFGAEDFQAGSGGDEFTHDEHGHGEYRQSQYTHDGFSRDEFEAPEEITSPHQAITVSQIAALEGMMSSGRTRASRQADTPRADPTARFPAASAARPQAPGGLHGPLTAPDTGHQSPPLAPGDPGQASSWVPSDPPHAQPDTRRPPAFGGGHVYASPLSDASYDAPPLSDASYDASRSSPGSRHQAQPQAPDARRSGAPNASDGGRPESTVSADTVLFESPVAPDTQRFGPAVPPDTQRSGSPVRPDGWRSGPASGTTYGRPRPSGAWGTGGPATSPPRGTGGPATSAPRGPRGPAAAAAGGFGRPGQPQGPAGPRRPDRLTILAAVLALAIFGGLIYLLIPGSHPAQPVHSDAADGLARHHAATHHGSHAAKHTGSATHTAPSASNSVLTPARAVAFGPGGPAHGDNPQNAQLAIDRNPSSGWQTDWYATATFGNLKSGTGLLLDMGHPVTITSARINLGSASGADLQLRVGGPAAVLRDLRPAASAANAGGSVRLHLTSPAHARYVLIWFTKLPPDSTGTYRASVYNVVLRGQG